MKITFFDKMIIAGAENHNRFIGTFRSSIYSVEIARQSIHKTPVCSPPRFWIVMFAAKVIEESMSFVTRLANDLFTIGQIGVRNQDS